MTELSDRYPDIQAVLSGDSEGCIVQGDCLEILPLMPDGSVDAVVTDPPYGIGHTTGWEASWSGKTIAGDANTSARDRAIPELIRLCTGAIFCFGTWKAVRPLGVHTCLIWDKGPASGMGDLRIPWKQSFEEIYVIGTGEWVGPRDEGVLRGHIVVTWESRGRHHPNAKPVSLVKYLIRLWNYLRSRKETWAEIHRNRDRRGLLRDS